MNRKKAIKLLKSGEEGVKEWNRRRKAGAKIPELSEANVSGADRANLGFFAQPQLAAERVDGVGAG